MEPLAIGGRMIPWFELVAPTGGKGRRFYDEMLQIAPNIRAALGIQMESSCVSDERGHWLALARVATFFAQ